MVNENQSSRNFLIGKISLAVRMARKEFSQTKDQWESTPEKSMSLTKSKTGPGHSSLPTVNR
jgi:hypothetical protein